MSSGNDTAGIIIIGDEILRGDIRETNVYHICSRLRAVGIRVERVSIIPDVVPVIAEEVRKFSASYSYVITSGGVGPTHDDVTYESVARAFDEDVSVNTEVLAAFQTLYGPRSGSETAISKFATIPRSSRILFGNIQRPGRVLRLPLVCARNVYMLPGVPLALEALFPLFLKDCEDKGHKSMYFTELFIKSDELSITASLNKAVEQFKNKVKFGSYPTLDNNYYRVRLALEAEREEDVADAKKFLLEELPVNSVTNFDRDPLTDSWQKLSVVAERKPHVAASIKVIEDAIDKYTVEGLSLGFSGGKDCTVILHMFYAVLQKRQKSAETTTSPPKIQCLFMRSKGLWPDTVSFIENSAQLYDCDMTAVPEGDYKAGVERYLSLKPGVKAFLLGNRSTDPGGDKLKHFTPTDEGWPQVMRVFPVLDWSYKDVWDFIRDLSLPYCSLYDQGYSSIGDNEAPNEVLMYIDSRGAKRFKPAYMLEDAKLERCGRK